MLRITDWPTRLLRVRHQDAEWDAHLDLVALPVGIPTSPGVILEGNTDDAMKSLISDGRSFAAICVDFPHFASLDTASRLGRQTVSISIAKQIFGDACQALRSDGRIIVLADCWAAPWVLVALEDCGSLRLDQITCWQKRYSGLQDKRGQVDSSFDLIFEVVHAAGGTHSAPKIELLAEGAGTRSEDATKEEAALKETGVYGSQVSPSKQAKPLRLCTQLLARSPNGPILELFSDSGYFAAAAAAVGRSFVCVADSAGGDAAMVCARIRGRLGTATTHVRLPNTPTTLADTRDLRSMAITEPILTKGRDAEFSVVPICFSSSPDGDKALAVVSEQDPFFGLSAFLRKHQAVALLNCAGACTQSALPQRIHDWFEAAGETALCAIQAGILDSLRLASWAGCKYGVTSQRGLILDCSSEKSLSCWLVLSPSEHDRRFSLPTSGNYANPTDDPRGPFRDEFKGARGGNAGTSQPYNAPPYRFELIDGALPDGCCRMDVFSGVIHAPKLTKAGVFRSTVRVSDSSGASAISEFTFEISAESAGSADRDTEVWWLLPPIEVGSGELKLHSRKVIRGVLGDSLSVLLRASGGSPFIKLLMPSDRKVAQGDRFWPWNATTLVSRILENRIGFGKNGDAKFQNRIFKRDKPDERFTVHSWWGKKNIENWGVSSVLDGLVELLSVDRTLLVSDCDLPASSLPHVHVKLDPAPVTTRRTRIRGISVPILDWASQGCAEQWFQLLGVATLPIPEQLKALGVVGLGTPMKGGHRLVLLAPSMAPTTRLVSSLHEFFGKSTTIEVLYFRGATPANCSARFRRIPFDVNDK